MTIIDLINIINEADYNDRQRFIDALYMPKLKSVVEKQNQDNDDIAIFKNTIAKELERHNLIVPKELDLKSIKKTMKSYLNENEFNEYELLINSSKNELSLLQITLYYIVGK